MLTDRYRDVLVEPGIYRHTTTSTHLYVEDVERAEKLVSTWYADGGPSEQPRVWQPRGIGAWGSSFREAQLRARALGTGHELPLSTRSELWFAQRLVRRNEGS